MNRKLKSKISGMISSLPILGRSSSPTSKLAKIKRRDSNLSLLMMNSVPKDNKKRQDKEDYDLVTNMLKNKQMVGSKKVDAQNKSPQHVQTDHHVGVLEPLEVMPYIKGLRL